MTLSVNSGPVTAEAAAPAAGLRIEALSVRIPLRRHGAVHAVTDVSIEVPAGSVTAIVGESGCGKSMIAAAVTGLLPPRATVTGSVEVSAGGKQWDALHDASRLRGRTVALIPQSPATSFTPVRTLGAQLDETIRAVGSLFCAADLVTQAGLTPTALDLYPHELSGGMAQRAAIAAAIAGDPAVLLADEPTSSLDRARTDEVLALLRARADAGAAVLLITHDVSALLRTAAADSLAVMYASRLMESGSASDVFSEPMHPYTTELLAALPERGLRPMSRIPPSLTNLGEECLYSGARSALVRRGGRVVREPVLTC